MTARKLRAAPKGSVKPRIAPPTPARSDLPGFRDAAKSVGITLMAWQEVAARYIEAISPDGKPLYREVGVVVSRQNGKTTLLIPLIVKRLREGRRIMHTAQDRNLPREVFLQVAELMWTHHRDLFPMRNGRPTKPRYANGQEEIRLTNGGIYSIVAPTRSGARGPTRDLVIIDELREMDGWEFIAAAKPTLTVSPFPQMLYLSNAGEENSVVLNALRKRAETDPVLAYLEWSAAPERKPDDMAGWMESNPAMGHEPEGMGLVVDTLTSEYRTAVLEQTLPKFEVEHLCRWVTTTAPAIVRPEAWSVLEAELAIPVRPVMGIALDQSGTRASGVVAWRQSDGSFGVRVVADVTGEPVDVDRFGPDLRDLALRLRVLRVVFDPYDEHLARHFRKPVAMNGRDYANACATFVRLIEQGSLHWQDSDAITADIPWATRRTTGPGAWMAVKAKDDRPITAVLAAIRAVGAAYGPAALGQARIY